MMEFGVVVAIAMIFLAVLGNALLMAYNYGRLSQKVKDITNHLTELTKEMKEVGTKVSRMEGILNKRR